MGKSRQSANLVSDNNIFVDIVNDRVGIGTTVPVGQLQVSNGPVIVGTATSTGTASQRLQVTGGSYISGNLGVAHTNPTSRLDVVGDGNFTGVVTATTFSGSIIDLAATFTGDVSIGSTVGIGTVFDIIPYDTLNSGTLAFESNIGQLFSFSNNLTSGSIFAVNDISSIPCIDVNASGSVQLAPYLGNVGVGTTNPQSKLSVFGGVSVTGVVTATTINDSSGNVRGVPQNSKTTSYTLVSSDAGKHISITSGDVTIPAFTFNVGDAISIFNNSETSQRIIQDSNVTLRQAATTSTGSRNLAGYGICTVLCVSSNVFVVSGAGLS